MVVFLQTHEHQTELSFLCLLYTLLLLILEKFKHNKESNINMESVPNVKLIVLALTQKFLLQKGYLLIFKFLFFNKTDNNISAQVADTP